MAVSNIDPNSMIVLDHELGQVITFPFVIDLSQHNDDPRDQRIYHLDVSGLEHVYDDIESMLLDFGMKHSQCSWMLGPYMRTSQTSLTLLNIVSND